MSEELIVRDLSGEEYREVVFVDSGYVLRIDDPETLYMRCGGTTQRVVDAKGLVHLYPGPLSGRVVIRWKPRDRNHPVSF